MNKMLLTYKTPKKQVKHENSYKILISQDFTGLCNQLWSVISGIIMCIKDGKRVLLIDKFLLNVHTNSYCSIGKILCLPSMNIFLQKYNIVLVDGVQINERNTPGLKVLKPFDWKIVTDPANDSIKNELYQNIRFVPSIVAPALKFVNDSQNNQKKGTINVIHLRIEQDWLDHVSSGRKPRLSPAVIANQIAKKYIDLIQKHIQRDELTFILTGSSNNKVVDYLRNNKYTYFMFPKITPYR
jgi:hypothetical protein